MMSYKIGIFTPLEILDKKYKVNDITNPVHMLILISVTGIWLFGFIWVWLPYQMWNDAMDAFRR